MSGWATAVSLIVSASETVPCATRSSPGGRREPAQPVAHPGQLEPGREEAGGLGALSRADDDEHVSTLPRWAVTWS